MDNLTAITTINQSLNETINQSINQTVMFLGQTIPFTGSVTLDIFIITLFAALFMTLVNKYLSDQVRIKSLRKEMKEVQKKMRKFMVKDPEKAKALQKEMMKKNIETMKLAMNPKVMLITMVPLLGVFTLVAKYYGSFGEFFNFFGLTTFGWLGTYIIFVMINSLILKKVLDVA